MQLMEHEDKIAGLSPIKNPLRARVSGNRCTAFGLVIYSFEKLTEQLRAELSNKEKEIEQMKIRYLSH